MCLFCTSIWSSGALLKTRHRMCPSWQVQSPDPAISACATAWAWATSACASACAVLSHCRIIQLHMSVMNLATAGIIKQFTVAVLQQHSNDQDQGVPGPPDPCWLHDLVLRQLLTSACRHAAPAHIRPLMCYGCRPGWAYLLLACNSFCPMHAR